jgi:hypothetical protein
MDDFCNKVVTIPQYNETCWFNTILMSLLYSQNSRKLLLNKIQTQQYSKQNKLMRIISRILKSYYVNQEKAQEYFKIFKPEVILSYIVGIENKKQLKEMIYSGWYSSMFLNTFIESIGCNCLTINYFTGRGRSNKLYAGITELIYFQLFGEYLHDINEITSKIKQITEPDYICINMFNSNQLNGSHYTRMTYLQNIKKDFELDSYGFTYSGIKELNDVIVFNGNTYILDSCILSNYNIDYDQQIGHSIAGITCKTMKYVYNGWMRITKDKAKNNEDSGNPLPCELMKFNWNIHQDAKFCINDSLCKLPTFKNKREEYKSDLCFSFAKGNRTLIYVKQDTQYLSVNSNSLNTSTSLSSQRSLHILDSISSNKYADLDVSSLNEDELSYICSNSDEQCAIKNKKLAKYFEIHEKQIAERKELKRKAIEIKKQLKLAAK